MKKIILYFFMCMMTLSSFAALKTWKGAGVMSGNGGTDFNNASNWTGGMPGGSDQAIMNLNSSFSFNTISFSAASTTINQLNITLSGFISSTTLDVGGKLFTINGTTTVDVPGAAFMDINVGNLGILTYGGNADFGASGGGICYFADGAGGTSGSVIFKGDLTINPGARSSNSTGVNNLPAKFIFDGTGNQTIIDNGGSTNYNYIALLQINATSIVTLSSSSVYKNNVQPNDITILGTLIIPNLVTINRISPPIGGTLSMSPLSTLKLAGSTGGFGNNSNFPNNYSIVTLDSTSTVELNGTAQTIPQPTAATVYGNLTLSGSGTTKTVGGNISIHRALDINSGVVMALGDKNVTLKSNPQTTAFVKSITSSNITYGAGRFVIERYLSPVASWRLLATPVQTLLNDATTPSISASWREGEAVGIYTIVGKGTRITGPVTGGTMDGVTQRASMKSYNMANNTYVDVKAADLALPIQKDQGYYVFVRGDRTIGVGGVSATTLKIPGKLRTDNQTFSVIKNLAPAAGFQSVGNPYASRIDVRNVILASGGVSTSFYI